jgi:hypothetical protein
MRVIRLDSGWDIALDIVFTDKDTAYTIAERIQHPLHALIRDAVDASMCKRKAPRDAGGETLSRRGSFTNLSGSPIATRVGGEFPAQSLPTRGQVCRGEEAIQRGLPVEPRR